MNIVMKGMIATALAAGGAMAVSTPAAAQSFGVYVGNGPGYGYYGGPRFRDRGWYGGGPRFRDRGYYGYRGGYRHRDRYRAGWRGGGYDRCWREWRYDPYRDRRVRVRICR